MVDLTPETRKRFLGFGVVGGLGFIVDTGLTLAMIGRGLDPFSARMIAIVLAMFATWRLNRALTFGASQTSQSSEGARYFVVASLTAVLNYTIYAGVLLAFPGLWPVAAIVFATAISMIASYLGFSRFAFRTAA